MFKRYLVLITAYAVIALALIAYANRKKKLENESSEQTEYANESTEQYEDNEQDNENVIPDDCLYPPINGECGTGYFKENNCCVLPHDIQDPVYKELLSLVAQEIGVSIGADIAIKVALKIYQKRLASQTAKAAFKKLFSTIGRDMIEEAAEKAAKEAAEKAGTEAAEKAAKEAAEKAAKEAAERALKEAAEKAAQEAAEKVAQEAATKTIKEASEKATKEALEKAARETLEKTATEGSEKALKQAAKKAAEEAAQEAAEKAAQEAAEKAAQEAAEKAAQEAAEKAAKEAAEKAAREAAEKAAKEAAEKIARETAEKAARETAQKAGKELSEKVLKKIGDKAAQEAAAKATKEAAEKAAKEASEKLTKEAAEKFAKEMSKKLAKEVAEKAASKAATEAAQMTSTKLAMKLAKAVAKKSATRAVSLAAKLKPSPAMLFDIASFVVDVFDPAGYNNFTANAVNTNFRNVIEKQHKSLADKLGLPYPYVFDIQNMYEDEFSEACTEVEETMGLDWYQIMEVATPEDLEAFAVWDGLDIEDLPENIYNEYIRLESERDYKVRDREIYNLMRKKLGNKKYTRWQHKKYGYMYTTSKPTGSNEEGLMSLLFSEWTQRSLYAKDDIGLYTDISEKERYGISLSEQGVIRWNCDHKKDWLKYNSYDQNGSEVIEVPDDYIPADVALFTDEYRVSNTRNPGTVEHPNMITKKL